MKINSKKVAIGILIMLCFIYVTTVYNKKTNSDNTNKTHSSSVFEEPEKRVRGIERWYLNKFMF